MPEITVSKRVKKLLDELVELNGTYPQKREVDANEALESVLKHDVDLVKVEIKAEGKV